MKKRKVCVVTSSRSEYAGLRQTLEEIKNSKYLELLLVVTGAHLSKDFGYTVREIIKGGFSVARRVKMLGVSDTKVGIGRSVGTGIMRFVDCLKILKPDIMLLLGDRYEIFAAAVAAMIMNVPIAHICGGELTAAAIDEQMRHAITKMSHVHFVALPENAKIVKQMGEESWRIHVVGTPWVDYKNNMEKISRKRLRKILGLKLSSPFPSIFVTYHPVTLRVAETSSHIKSLLDALDEVDAEIIFSYPNADTSGRTIISAIENFVKTHPHSKVFKSLGSTLYLNLLSHLDLVVGNSSSGVVETQMFELPVVNIGDRQEGRLMTENIICSLPEKQMILKSIKKGLSKEFKESIRGMKNPYDRGGMAKIIVNVLSELNLGLYLLKKKFVPIG